MADMENSILLYMGYVAHPVLARICATLGINIICGDLKLSCMHKCSKVALFSALKLLISIPLQISIAEMHLHDPALNLKDDMKAK